MVSSKVQRSYFRLVLPEFYLVVFISTKVISEGFGGALGTLALFLYSQLWAFLILF
jgi:hypothetical protein